MTTRRSFFGTIRFKLTAWYAVGLGLILIGVGLLLSSLIERDLRRDIDARLWSTAQELISYAELNNDPYFGRSLSLPQVDPFSQSDIYIQRVDENGAVVDLSVSLQGRILPLDERNSRPLAPRYTTKSIDGVPVRLLYFPLVSASDGEHYGTIIIGTSSSGLYNTLDSLSRLLLWVGGVGIVVAVVGGWLLAGRALRPVGAITATAARIANSADSSASLATRLDVPNTGDEIAQLAATFNRMLDRIEQTFAAHQRFVADASHELRTPLTAIRGNIDVMLRQSAPLPNSGGDMVDALEDVRRESVRMSRLIEDLLTLARSEAPPEPQRRRPVRLDLIVHDAARTASGLATGQQLEVDAPMPVTVMADRDRLTQLLLILLDNAIRHTPPSGRIVVSLTAAAGSARLTVTDSGSGIAPEHLPHLFDRFYRADAARDRATGGTGLGLSIAKAIAAAFDGELTVASVVHRGTSFTATFPLASARLVAADQPAASA